MRRLLRSISAPLTLSLGLTLAACQMSEGPDSPSPDECMAAHRHVIDLQLAAARANMHTNTGESEIDGGDPLALHRDALDHALRERVVASCLAGSRATVRCLDQPTDLDQVRRCSQEGAVSAAERNTP
jgi:hypothetical protein